MDFARKLLDIRRTPCLVNRGCTSISVCFSQLCAGKNKMAKMEWNIDRNIDGRDGKRYHRLIKYGKHIWAYFQDISLFLWY